MSLSILLVAIGLCLAIVYLVKQVYLFQIKEYRFDRIRARIEDKGILDFLYGLDVRIPSTRHPRNIALLLIGCILLTIVSQGIPQTTWMGILLIVLAPMIALLATALGVLITNIPVSLHRNSIIQKARGSLSYINPTIIGITGSYGKSTTKEYLSHILSRTFKVAKTDRNQNTAIGVALSLVHNLKKETQFFIAEMGAYKRGEIEEITRFASPKIAIVTAIGTQHLSLFGGKEALFKAKSEIVKALPKDGRLFLASSIDRILKLRLERLAACPTEQYDTVPNDPHESALHAAIAVARYLKVPEETIQKAAQSLTKPPHLLAQAHRAGHTFIDCSYSSNVEGFIAHMHMLRSLKKHKKIILTSGIIELGKHRKYSYSQILQALPAHTTFYTTDRTFQHAATPTQARSIVFRPSISALIALIEKELDSDSAILIEGRFRPDYLAGIIA